MRLINNYLELISKKNSQIILFILLNICGLIFIFLPYDIFKYMLDLHLYYDAETVYSNYVAIGEDGRHINLYSTLILDTMYPILYTSLILGAFVKLYSRQHTFIFMIPVLAFFLDISENLQLAYMNLTFMHLNTFQVMVASACTSLKWIVLSTMILLLLIGVIKKKS